MWNTQFATQLTLVTTDLYPASVKTANGVKWGYIDSRGQFRIPPQFDFAEDFQSNGLAVVQVGNRSGLIDRAGAFLVTPTYSTITSFTEGRAQVVDDRGFQVMDETGGIITREPYDYIGMYQNGRALYADTDAQGRYLYGYLDRSGQEVIPRRYLSATDFLDGKAVAQVAEREYALIGRNGERLQTYPYAYVGPLRDGLLPFSRSAGGPYGYLNETGAVVIEPRFAMAQPFENGRAVVNTSTDPMRNQYGLIDQTGRFVIAPAYNDILLLGESRVALGKARKEDAPYVGSRYAIADTDGRILSGFLYNDVGRFASGYASASTDASTFFIDRRGNRAESFPAIAGGGTVAFTGNLIKAHVAQRVSYYTRTGKLVWKQNTVIPLGRGYRVREEKYAPNPNYLVYYPQIEGMGSRQAEVNRRLREMSQVKPIDPKAQLDYSYTGDFFVAFYRKQLLVLELVGDHYAFGAAHGMPTRVHAHVDLETGQFYSLQDLFLPDSGYVQVLSEIVGRQLKQNPAFSYVFPDAYTGIRPDQPFYVKADALYLYFAPYDIAPYAAGFPTFRIPYREIRGIINRSGSFWRSFHE